GDSLGAWALGARSERPWKSKGRRPLARNVRTRKRAADTRLIRSFPSSACPACGKRLPTRGSLRGRPDEGAHQRDSVAQRFGTPPDTADELGPLRALLLVERELLGEAHRHLAGDRRFAAREGSADC